MDPFFQLREFDFTMPGLDREYKLLHISDIHLAEWDVDCTPEEIAYGKEATASWEKGRFNFARAFGDSVDEVHVIPLHGYLQKWIELANEIKPDVILCTGDLMERITSPNLRCLKEMLPRFEAPFLWVRGNHDGGEESEYIPFMGEHPAWQVFRLGKLKLILLDNSKKEITADQLAHLREEAEDGCLPVLAAHIPIRTEENDAVMAKVGEYFTIAKDGAVPDTRAFLEYITAPECPISLFLCGHVHGCMISQYAEGKTQLTATSTMLGGGNIIRLLPQ